MNAGRQVTVRGAAVRTVAITKCHYCLKECKTAGHLSLHCQVRKSVKLSVCLSVCLFVNYYVYLIICLSIAYELGSILRQVDKLFSCYVEAMLTVKLKSQRET